MNRRHRTLSSSVVRANDDGRYRTRVKFHENIRRQLARTKHVVRLTVTVTAAGHTDRVRVTLRR